MVKEIRIHFEGHPALKEGFRQFFGEVVSLARERRWHVQFIAGHGRGNTIRDYCDACESHRLSWNVLLIDSEGPDDGKLFQKLGLPAAKKDSVFWMVQLMESWFLADIQALKQHYGANVMKARLRGNPKIEEIPKADVIKRLRAAVRTPKRSYDKVEDTPRLLRLLDPAIVRAACPNCERIFRIMTKRIHSR